MLIRSGLDLKMNYQDINSLKRMRMAYILHISDFLVSDRLRCY